MSKYNDDITPVPEDDSLQKYISDRRVIGVSLQLCSSYTGFGKVAEGSNSCSRASTA